MGSLGTKKEAELAVDLRIWMRLFDADELPGRDMRDPHPLAVESIARWDYLERIATKFALSISITAILARRRLAARNKSSKRMHSLNKVSESAVMNQNA
jgi:hypothetical protein